ncbi:hypothetical protein FOB22_003269 [Saccharomyces cerevisiae]|nr:hypothetical protein FOB22_003269 [Saccharomyces cerevisiae]
MTSSLDDIEPTAYNNMEADEEYCRRNDIHDLSSVVGDAVSQGVPDMDGQTTDSSKDPEPNSEDKKAFPPSSGSFFSPNLQGQRKKVLLKFVFTNCLLAIICFTMFVLFWGALYDTSKYLHKVKLLVVIQEPPVVILDNNSSMVVPSISYALPTFINKIPCDWDIYNSSTFQAKFDVNTPQQVNDKVVDLETGRDPTNLKSTILPVAQTIEEYYHTFYTLNYLPALLTNITQVYRYALTDNARHIAAAGKYNYEYYDHRPFTDRILLAPTQIGVVYCLLLTFFQFLLYGPLHVEMAKVLRPANGLIYRIAMSWFTFFFASLFFCTTTAIFQVDFTKSFGRGGFVVYWMSTWLFMLAAGGANENAVMLVITLGPQYLGFWILSFVILNIAPSFFPLALNNNVYRYGYMMPVHNVIDIYRVIFFDVTRRKMGRNYGILVALIALNTALLPFVGKYASRKLKQKALVAAKQS